MASRILYVQLAFVGTSLLLLAWFSFNNALLDTVVYWKRVLLGILGMILLFTSMLYFWILSYRPPRHESIKSVTSRILLNTISLLNGNVQMRRLRASCKRPRFHQERCLQKIIKENGSSEYGRKFRLTEMKSLEEFRQRHPLTTYEHYRSYVERMMNGEKNVLTKRAPASYVRTTGTTGQSKYIPHVSRTQVVRKVGDMMSSMFVDTVRVGMLQKRLMLYVAPLVTKAKNGANIETMGTIPEIPDFAFAIFSTPPAGFRIDTLNEANYVHLLFGLREIDIGAVQCGFVHFIESTMKQLEGCWRQIVYDIGHGTINPHIKLRSDIRTHLTKALAGGDPERAEQLRREFGKGFHGIMKRVWPRVCGVIAIDSTGVWPKLENTYACGLYLQSSIYGCSEAMIAVGLAPKYLQKGYLFLTDDVVFELIKLEEIHTSEPKTYFVDEAEVGQCYEVVLTQISGLYRYRLGDIIRIISYYDNAPVIEFMYRTGMMLNLRYEKMDQKVVKESICAFVDKWPDASLSEFAVAESTLLPEDCSVFEPDEIMPYYLIFLELGLVAGREKVVLSPEEKQMIDDELRLRNSDYERLRRENSISHPRVHIVRPGTFDELKHYLLTNTNATANQYKSPRKLRTLPMVEVMLKNILQ